MRNWSYYFAPLRWTSLDFAGLRWTSLGFSHASLDAASTLQEIRIAASQIRIAASKLPKKIDQKKPLLRISTGVFRCPLPTSVQLHRRIRFMLRNSD